jgi:uncharacterized protein (TIGR01777 family)
MANRIIITGATGFIGQHLAEHLAAAGYEVIALTRRPRLTGSQTGSIKSVIWDGKTARGWQEWVDDALAVVNLAGENIAAGRWSADQKKRILSSRLQAGQAVMAAIVQSQHRPQVLVQASAVGYYGHQPEQICDESSPAGSGFLADVTRQWEAVTASAEHLGLRRVIIRTGVVLGKTGGALPRLFLPFRFFLGGAPGHGRQGFSWIHLNDEIRAIRFLIEQESLQGVFNLTAPEPLTSREFAKIPPGPRANGG